ncbi:MAG: hypothetical protein M0T71_13460, partial [Actinomycetota bacterium]|nr:hypothetical protein [Actinomycetota bacterium]
MMTLNLSQLDLGALAAENDTDLVDYFLQTEAFTRVFAAKKWLVLGNRGAGKTAIFSYLAGLRNREAHVVQLAP